MIKSTDHTSVKLILIVCLISALVGALIAYFGVSFQLVLAVVILFVIVFILIQGKKSLQTGFLVWVWSFIIGYRTIPITPYFRIHPLIVLLTLLSIILLGIFKNEKGLRLKLPNLIWLFSIFWIWGFIVGGVNSLKFTNMIADALNFFFLVPLFYIILYLSKYPNFWKMATMSFLGSGVLICFLGILEYYVPAFSHLIPGLVQAQTEGLPSFSGFTRASFAFWGANPAVLVSALSLPMVVLVPHYYKGWAAKFLALVFFVIIAVGVYISGTRVAWMMLFLTTILISFFSYKYIGLALTAAFWFVASRFFTADMWTLIVSVTTPLTTGQVMDSSINKRITRQSDAIQLALDHPFGVGWTGSGWVHGDFTQVAANLGILAGVIFLLWYLITLLRGWKMYRDRPKDNVFFVLLTCFILAGVILALEGAEVLPQYIMPVWFVWGLMEAYLQQNKTIQNTSFKGEKWQRLLYFYRHSTKKR